MTSARNVVARCVSAGPGPAEHPASRRTTYIRTPGPVSRDVTAARPRSSVGRPAMLSMNRGQRTAYGTSMARLASTEASSVRRWRQRRRRCAHLRGARVAARTVWRWCGQAVRMWAQTASRYSRRMAAHGAHVGRRWRVVHSGRWRARCVRTRWRRWPWVAARSVVWQPQQSPYEARSAQPPLTHLLAWRSACTSGRWQTT